MLPFLRADLAALSVYKSEDSQLSIAQSDKLDANEVSLDLPQWFKQKLAVIVEQEIQANRYPDGEYLPLKQAIATYVGNRISDRQISIGNGSDEIIRSLLLISCLNRGKVLVAEPTFSMYGILAQSLGIEVVRVPRLENFEIDLDTANHSLAGVAAVFVVHPNSPTGNLLTDREIIWLRLLPEHILTVIDEAYFEFSENTLVNELESHSNWVILRTFSKAFRLAAYRVGYAIAHPEVIENLEKVRLPYNLSTISYQAALLALQNHSTLLENISEIQQEREKFYQACQLFSLKIYPSFGNYLYLRTGKDAEIQQALKGLGTKIRHTGGGLRITVGTEAENAHTLARLKSCL
jgi:histidinol-phosphate aminotransferase